MIYEAPLTVPTIKSSKSKCAPESSKQSDTKWCFSTNHDIVLSGFCFHDWHRHGTILNAYRTHVPFSSLLPSPHSGTISDRSSSYIKNPCRNSHVMTSASDPQASDPKLQALTYTGHVFGVEFKVARSASAVRRATRVRAVGALRVTQNLLGQTQTLLCKQNKLKSGSQALE